MKGFEFLHNITIGQYLPTGSTIHRLHPATKMMVSALLVSALIISTSLSGLMLMLILTGAGMVVAKIPLRYAAGGLRPAIPIIVLVAVLQVLFVSGSDGGQVFWEGWIITITARDFLVAGTTALRLIVLVLVISFFTLTTGVKELTHGTERLLRPLSRIGFPGHELALVVTIALRFLPILSLEAEHLVKAQASRGADFGRGRMGLFKRLYRMMPLLVPLFITSLRRGENLVLAMEARCYSGGSGRTQLIRFTTGTADIVATVGAVLVVALLLVMHFGRADQIIWSWFG
jgi:energy-coupling factor transport system permease protein